MDSWRVEALDVVMHNAMAFESMQWRAVHASKRGDAQEALGWVKLASFFAHRNHPGLYFAPILEEVARGISSLTVSPHIASGGSTPTTSSAKVHGGKKRLRVVHVLTRAEPTGGHTRLAWRWIANDSGSSHSAIITDQGLVAVPLQLELAVSEAGGTITSLGRTEHGTVGRAINLANQLAYFDVAILHTHPDDTIPLLAVGQQQTCPIAILNHADHLFWLNASIADVIINTRTSAQLLSIDRRGFEAVECKMLPIPLPQVQRNHSRRAAKALLGLPDDSQLLLTMASDYKYSSVIEGDPHFISVLVPTLEKHPSAILRAIGPEPEGVWAQAAQATSGRLRALGVMNDPSLWLQAADIYLDSFPHQSITSRLEAAQLGTPVLSYVTSPRHALPFGGGEIGEVALSTFYDLGAFREHLSRILTQDGGQLETPLAPHDLGGRSGSGWGSMVQSIYSDAVVAHHAGARLPKSKRQEPSPQTSEPNDSDLYNAILQEMRNRHEAIEFDVANLVRGPLSGIPVITAVRVAIRAQQDHPTIWNLLNRSGGRRRMGRVWSGVRNVARRRSTIN